MAKKISNWIVIIYGGWAMGWASGAMAMQAMAGQGRRWVPAVALAIAGLAFVTLAVLRKDRLD